ncbi:helix-turn-helix transcriptional regulator [Enterococcus sp. AZ103]|uniref:helix-turn-helix transcriptional regulator n=1 Tax=Enterococcus sp. AZ103 TaxID=2774628 RepID=UPI003F24A6F8
MDNQIGRQIFELRKEQQITQQQLAEFLNVTKASVSKWENGQSYPDITLLPLIASYFNQSIDNLLGYSQLSKKEIENIYRRLKKELSKKPNETLQRIRQMIKRYWSCYDFVFSMASLLMNHLSVLDEDSAEIEGECLSYLLHVFKNTDELTIKNQAKMLLGSIWIERGETSKVFELFGDKAPTINADEMIIAAALQRESRFAEAESVLQITLYQYLIIQLNIFGSYLSLPNLSKERINQTIGFAEGLIETFKIETFHPMIVLMLRLSLAQMFVAEQPEKTLNQLEKFAELFEQTNFPIHLKGNGYFNKVDVWFDDLLLGDQTPRDTMLVKEDLIQGVIANPSFESLAEQPRFKAVIEILLRGEKNDKSK